MRLKLYIFICLTLIFVGCFEDKNADINDTYAVVQSVSGVKAADDASHELYLGKQFVLTPQIVFSANSTASDYDYRWLVGKSEVISTEKDLAWQIELPEGYSLNREIPGVLVIRNRNNGLEYREEFKFKVLNGYTPKYIAIYETSKGGIEWMSLQGEPTQFTDSFADMIRRVNGASATLMGKYQGAFNATSEIAIFTDHAPDYGKSISLTDTEAGSDDFVANMGDIVAPIRGRVYRGGLTTLNFRDVFYGTGGVKYLRLGNSLYAFDGMSKKLPVFDENTFRKAENVAQIISSKQYMSMMKANIVRFADNTVGSFHAYTTDVYRIMEGGQPFTVDELCGMFSEGKGIGSTDPYITHLIARKGNAYNMYVFNVTNSGTVKPLTLSKTIPMPEDVVKKATFWYGAFAQRYGFYTTTNEIYKFDYLNIAAFNPESMPLKSYDPRYTIVNVFIQSTGTGKSIKDYCTVVYLYDAALDKTTIDVFETVSGTPLANYKDIIPGRGVDFIKR